MDLPKVTGLTSDQTAFVCQDLCISLRMWRSVCYNKCEMFILLSLFHDTHLEAAIFITDSVFLC